jgi:hypothetical protein
MASHAEYISTYLTFSPQRQKLRTSAIYAVKWGKTPQHLKQNTERVLSSDY